MKACIRRGAHQIGGTCVELEAQGQRIVLDLGLPLGVDSVPELLPPVPGLRLPDPSLLAVFISHAHQDHYGLLEHAAAGPRVFIGADAARMMQAASLFWPGALDLEETEPLRDRLPIKIGPFRVTPYLVDHSAYDAYALLVEADGERLFYSGDLRAHGRKASLFERLLRDGPRGVDALLLEGTTIGRVGGERPQTEAELEHEMVTRFRDTPGLVLLQVSTMNIDRLVTVFRACRKAGRQFIIDAYAAAVLRATGNDRLPQVEWEGVRVYLPRSQKHAITKAQAFALTQSFKGARIYPEALAAEAGRSVILFRSSMMHELEAADCLDGARLVYSLWPGYLKDQRQAPLMAWLEARSIPMFICHSSGHASPHDLERLVKALSPRTVVPIHSDVPERYAVLFAGARPHADGEWWAVADRTESSYRDGAQVVRHPRKDESEMTQRPVREGAPSPEQGLHLLKDEWRQKSYLEEDCRALTAHLDAAIRATFAAARERGERGYRLSRADGAHKAVEEMGSSSKERQREAELFAAYGPGSGLSVPAVWHRLVAYQIPLFDSVAREGWGNVDLLGLTEAGDPVVVELKIGESQDTPLHALLEAATYAVALRKSWVHVARELEAVPAIKELGLTVSAAPTTWRLVLLAPRAYWESWSTRTATGRTVSDSARAAYLQLCEAFAVEHMPVQHAEIGEEKGLSIQRLPDGLPQ